MSNDLFPTLAGLQWDRIKKPEFNTNVQTAVDLSELRSSFASAPIYNFVRQYDVLRDDTLNNELKTLMGFFLSHYGSWDSWLIQDDDDYSVTAQPFGTGDGAATQFQLARSLGSFGEKVSNLNATPSIYKNAVLQTSNYSINSTGLVTFTSPPTAGVLLTWTGTYYYRCRFANDVSEFNQFMRNLWENQQVEFRGCLGTKI